MNPDRLFSKLERVLQRGARLWTWEVLFLYDEEPSIAHLTEMFRRDFPMLGKNGHPFFLKMVAFNSESGRKIRYLVVFPSSPEEECASAHDRLLPDSIALYGIADKVIRGTEPGLCECAVELENQDASGNAVFSFLWNDRLFILVFCGGRLCHWSEEVGYEDGFGGEAYENRMERFRKFLELDEFFSQSLQNKFFEYRKNVSPWTAMHPMMTYFRRAACDPFWIKFDLDNRRRVKPLVQKGVLSAVMLLFVFTIAFLGSGGTLAESQDDSHSADDGISLSPPPVFIKSEEPRDSLYRYSLLRHLHAGNSKNAGERAPHDSLSRIAVPSPQIRLRSIVEGVVFQGLVDGSLKWFRCGDTIGLYRVKSIGRDRIVLEDGAHLIEVAHE